MIFSLREPTLKDFIRVCLNKTVFANKPLSVSVEGESGAGKSFLTLLIARYIQQLLKNNCDLKMHFIYTPEQFNVCAKHVFFENCQFPALFIQETVSFAPSWLHPLSKNNPAIKIYQILNMSREIKPIATFICEQQFTDLYAKLRYRMDLFFKVIRYVTSEGVSLNPILKIYVREKNVFNNIIFKEPIILVGGKVVKKPYFEIQKLRDELIKEFRSYDYEFKKEYIAELLETHEKSLGKNHEEKKRKKKEGKLVECRHCGYKWQYTGVKLLKRVMCPRCGETGAKAADN